MSDIPPLLLILDRRDDPVTPLLSQVRQPCFLAHRAVVTLHTFFTACPTTMCVCVTMYVSLLVSGPTRLWCMSYWGSETTEWTSQTHRASRKTCKYVHVKAGSQYDAGAASVANLMGGMYFFASQIYF